MLLRRGPTRHARRGPQDDHDAARVADDDRAAGGSKAAQPDQAANFGGSNPSLTVDDKGNVYVAWITHSSNITPAPLPAVWLSKSTDGGKTYVASAITPFQQGLSTFGSQRIRWSPGGGPSGTLHVVYEGTTHPAVAGDTDAFYQRSTDGGAPGHPARALNDDRPRLPLAQITPNLNVAPNGRVDVAWWDTRNDPGIRAKDVYLLLVHRQRRDVVEEHPHHRPDHRPAHRHLGQRLRPELATGIASTDKFPVVGWDDTRNFTP